MTLVTITTFIYSTPLWYGMTYTTQQQTRAEEIALLFVKIDEPTHIWLSVKQSNWIKSYMSKSGLGRYTAPFGTLAVSPINNAGSFHFLGSSKYRNKVLDNDRKQRIKNILSKLDEGNGLLKETQESKTLSKKDKEHWKKKALKIITQAQENLKYYKI